MCRLSTKHRALSFVILVTIFLTDAVMTVCQTASNFCAVRTGSELADGESDSHHTALRKTILAPKSQRPVIAGIRLTDSGCA
jgi:hypothetical protein